LAPDVCRIEVAAAQANAATAGAIGERLRIEGAADINVLFDFNAATIRNDGRAQFDELGRALRGQRLRQEPPQIPRGA
jgi:outer membrane protein OmpA-like peptidoglycan-associated protein